MNRFASLFAALALSLPALASADAISPPPASCPSGSDPVDFCHGPETCQIADCTDTSDCDAGEECVERALCVREHCCGGISCAMDGAMPPRYTHVEGPCGAGGACAFSLGCETSRVCVPIAGVDAGPPDTDAGADMDGGGAGTDSGPSGTDAGPDTPTDGGCCSVVGHGHPLGGAVALVLVALIGLRLRRRR